MTYRQHVMLRPTATGVLLLDDMATLLIRPYAYFKLYSLRFKASALSATTTTTTTTLSYFSFAAASTIIIHISSLTTMTTTHYNNLCYFWVPVLIIVRNILIVSIINIVAKQLHHNFHYNECFIHIYHWYHYF